MAATDTLPRVTAIATKLFVREGCTAPFSQWQARFSRAASDFPGFLSIDLLPLTAGAAEWRVVQQFRSAGEMAHWLASAARQGLLDETAALREGPYLDETVPDFHAWGSVTEVVVTTVKPGLEAEFRAWCETIQAAQGAFAGYMGTYIQAPATPGQPFWTTLVRYSTPGELEAWLGSAVRRELIKDSGRFIESWKSHRMPSSFAGWFPGGAGGAAPAAWKQTALVLLVLFPVVALELRFLSPHLAGWNHAAGMFLGNAISVSLVSWPLVPLAIRGLGWWLRPRAAARLRAEILGAAVLLALYAAEVAIFWRVL